MSTSTNTSITGFLKWWWRSASSGERKFFLGATYLSFWLISMYIWQDAAILVGVLLIAISFTTYGVYRLCRIFINYISRQWASYEKSVDEEMESIVRRLRGSRQI